jgi:hypothetical protein
MNKDNILAVADAIEKHSIAGLGFNMNYCVSPADFMTDHTGQHCGTVACIAGWSRAIRQGSVPEVARTLPLFEPEPEIEWLGLSEDDAEELFYPDRYATDEVLDLGDVTTAQAVAVLRHLAETGEVDWSIASAQHEGNGETETQP